MAKEIKLPNLPSKLIRLAIKDLEWVEKNPKYKVNMSVWHVPSIHSNICHVCLAGSVMAHSLKLKHFQSGSPDEMAERSKLEALDLFRRGSLILGFEHLKIFYDRDLFGRMTEVRMPHYIDEPAVFKTEMLAMADYFEFVGY